MSKTVQVRQYEPRNYFASITIKNDNSMPIPDFYAFAWNEVEWQIKEQLKNL